MAEKKNTLRLEFSKGILKDNPLLVLLLGTCPALAVTTTAWNGLGMGLAATFVLVMSNLVISLLRNIIPDRVRIPSYITIIASLVTILQLFLQAYLPDLNNSLGIFIPLITVNCIILGRAEAFASKRPVLVSIADGLGMGIGFAVALFLIGSIREILGSGSFFGYPLSFIGGDNTLQPILIFALPPGGFAIYGLLIAISEKLSNYFYARKPAITMDLKNYPGSILEHHDSEASAEDTIIAAGQLDGAVPVEHSKKENAESEED
ncbi:MAG TPA: electron transport complex subunit E [Clostridiaceae bacterium]|nr:electron transport complex subunit E [Clostridiaceae bacterium]